MVLLHTSGKTWIVSAGSGEGSEDHAVGCRPTAGLVALHWGCQVPCMVYLPGIHVGAKIFSWGLSCLPLSG